MRFQREKGFRKVRRKMKLGSYSVLKREEVTKPLGFNTLGSCHVVENWDNGDMQL